MYKNFKNIDKIVYGYYNAIKKAWINNNNKNENQVFVNHQGQRRTKFPKEDTVVFVMNNIKDMNVIEVVRDPIYQIGSLLTTNSCSL